MNKLKNFPDVFYINLDSNKDRRDIIESKFKKYEINYTRINAIDGKKDNIKDFLYRGIIPPYMKDTEIACSISHLKAIEKFLESDLNEAIIMEDDCDLNISDLWPFNWGYVRSKIPFNFDVVQLIIICDNLFLKLHKRFIDEFSTACYLITRDYAKKLINIHLKENKIDFSPYISIPRGTCEDLIFNSGICYSMPLFLYTKDSELNSTIQENEGIIKSHQKNYDTIYDFWKNKSHCIDDWNKVFSYNPYFNGLSHAYPGEFIKVYDRTHYLREIFGGIDDVSHYNLKTIIPKEKKIKVGVYGICKNESQFIERFMKNLNEADGVFITDTGSTDDTVELLKKFGANVFNADLKEFRFDEARQKSLDNVPIDYDIVISLDLDEVIEPGWRKEIEELYQKNKDLDVIFYRINYAFNPDGTVHTSQLVGKIHSRQGWYWKYPIHEILEFSKDCKPNQEISNIVVNHYPDLTKSRKRSELFEIGIRDYSNDERMIFFYGRESFFEEDYDKAIFYFKRYLQITETSSKIFYEDLDVSGDKKYIVDDIHVDYAGIGQYRCNVCIMLAKIFQKRNQKPLKWALRATSEFPFSREAWYWLGQSWVIENNIPSAISAFQNCLVITDRNLILTTEEICWDDEHINKILKVLTEKII